MIKLFTAILLGLLPAGAAVAQTAVRTGEVLRGDLASNDFVEVIAVIDGRELLQYSDCYVFQVEGRSWPQIDVASTDMDPEVTVGRGSDCTKRGSFVDYDGGPDTDARLKFFARSSGTMYIKITSWKNKFGSYRLTLTKAPPPPERSAEAFPMLVEMESRYNAPYRWSSPNGDTPETYLVVIRCTAARILMGNTSPYLNTPTVTFAQAKAFVVGSGDNWGDEARRHASGSGYNSEDINNQIAEMIVSLGGHVGIGANNDLDFWCQN